MSKFFNPQSTNEQRGVLLRDTLALGLAPEYKPLSHEAAQEWIAEGLYLGIDLTLRDCEGLNVLHWAVRRHRKETVQLLCRPEILNVLDYAGMTPLMRAALDWRHDVFAALLEAGANPNIGDLKDHQFLRFKPEIHGGNAYTLVADGGSDEMKETLAAYDRNFGDRLASKPRAVGKTKPLILAR